MIITTQKTERIEVSWEEFIAWVEQQTGRKVYPIRLAATVDWCADKPFVTVAVNDAAQPAQEPV